MLLLLSAAAATIRRLVWPPLSSAAVGSQTSLQGSHLLSFLGLTVRPQADTSGSSTQISHIP